MAQADCERAEIVADEPDVEIPRTRPTINSKSNEARSIQLELASRTEFLPERQPIATFIDLYEQSRTCLSPPSGLIFSLCGP
jgi:hypothetical protein